MIIKYVLEDDNLLILILIALGICLTLDAGWLELTLLYVGNNISLTKWFIRTFT